MEDIYSKLSKYIRLNPNNEFDNYSDLINSLINSSMKTSQKYEFMKEFGSKYLKLLVQEINLSCRIVNKRQLHAEIHQGKPASMETMHMINAVMAVVVLSGVTDINDPVWLSEYEIDGVYTQPITIIADYCINAWIKDNSLVPSMWYVHGGIHSAIDKDYFKHFVESLKLLIDLQEDAIELFNITFPVHEPMLENVLLGNCKELLVDLAVYVEYRSECDQEYFDTVKSYIDKMNMKYLLANESKFFSRLSSKEYLMYYTPYWNRMVECVILKNESFDPVIEYTSPLDGEWTLGRICKSVEKLYISG